MTAMALDVRELNLAEIDWISGGALTIGDGSITISCCDVSFIATVSINLIKITINFPSTPTETKSMYSYGMRNH